MTTGIYLLDFGSYGQYIGQAVNVEKRWEEHTSSMYRNKSAAKVQHAFKYHGLPKYSLLMECHRDYLDIMENYFIQIKVPVLNTTVAYVFSDAELVVIEFYYNLFRSSILDLVNSYAEMDKKLTSLETASENLELKHQEELRDLRDKLYKLEVKKQQCMCKELREEFDEYILEVKEQNYIYYKQIKDLKTKLDSANRPWWKKLLGLS